MKKHIFGNCLIAVFLLLVVGAYAHASSLTDATIKHFIASMEAVQVLEDEYDMDEFDEEGDLYSDEDAGVPEKPMSESIARLKGHEVYGKLREVVQQHGFSDVASWAQVGDRIIKAWFAIEMREESPEMRSELDRAIREIEESPHMTDHQKQEIIQQMRQSMTFMEAMADAPEADIDAVRPHLDELRSALQ